MSFCAINDKHEQNLMVIWDLGRKCTYACSYCPPHRKNSWSAVASFEELKKTADDLERYSQLLNEYRDKPFRVAASFTGGEPTVNPAFFEFLVYLQEKYPHWNRTLTTNGFYSERKLRLVMKNTDYTTLSYHCEGSPDQKKRVRENIKIMVEEGYGFKVNVMFHEREDYFDECVELCKWFETIGVTYTPRIIGDQGDIKQGLKDKTVHTYTPDQMKWFKNYWDNKNGKKVEAKPIIEKKQDEIKDEAQPKKVVGQTIGRPCCGDRKMEMLNNDEWVQTKFLNNNNFQNWNCMINWYFLYIHQEIDKIWFHQTCQVNLNGEVNPISNISNFDSFIDTLSDQMKTGNMPYIRCPKTHCGCGLCVPKAKADDVGLALFKSHTKNIVPQFMERDRSSNVYGSLKHMVQLYDKTNGNETI